MDLLKFVQAIRRHLKLVIAATIIGATIGVATAYIGGDEAPVAKTRDYWMATHTVGIGNQNASSTSPFATLSRIAASATSPEVVNRVVKQEPELGLDAEGIQDRLGTLEDPNLQTVDVIAVSPNQRTAITIADATATQLIAYIDEAVRASIAQQRDDVAARLTALRNQRAALDGDLANPNIKGTDRDILEAQRDSLINEYRIVYDRFTNISDISSSSVVISLRPAVAETIDSDEYRTFVQRSKAGINNLQVQPRSITPQALPSDNSVGVEGPLPRGLLGALIGLLVGIGLALVLDHFDTRLHTREDFQRSLTAPVLAEIPRMSRREIENRMVLIRDAPMSRAAEAYRSIRSSLLFQREEVVKAGKPGFVVMVTSSGPKEGKTTASANLAVAFAEAGLSVLAVNCDFRRPNLRRMFGIANDPGKVLPTDVPGLSIVTNAVDDAGANPARVVAVQRTAVEQMRGRYDVIVLDTAPLLTTNDPMDVAPVADVVVLIARAGQTRQEALRQAVEMLDYHRVNVGGVVLVGVTSVPNAYYYYYSSTQAKAARSNASRNGNGAGPGRSRRGDGTDAVVESALVDTPLE